MSCIDRNRFWPARFRRVLCAIIFCLAAVCPAWAQTNFSSLIEQLSRASDRSSGSPGSRQTADFIASHFKNLGYAQTGTQQFSLPARVQTFSRIQVSGSNRSMDIDPFLSNAISPGTTGQEGISGPVVYVGKGDMADFNGRRIKDTLVVMDLDSSENWINALSLEAGALIYVYPDTLDRFLLEDKLELSPVDFPRFLMPRKKADDLFSNLEMLDSAPVTATLYSDLKWDNPVVENVYCLVPGTNADLAQELIIVEAFYDTRGFVPGKSPGADQACSIATLLDLAEFLKDHPPERPVLLVATQGQANALAGMREMVWALDTSSRQLKQDVSGHQETQVRQEEHLELLNAFLAGLHLTESQLDQVQETITETLKNQIDTLSNQLMQLRLEKDKDEARIKQLASRRMTLKSLEGKNNFLHLTPDETHLVTRLIPETLRRLQQTLESARVREKSLRSAMAFKDLVQAFTVQTVLSLHLSSHGSGIGAFNDGWLYEIKDTVNSFAPYVKLNDTLMARAEDTAEQMNLPNLLKDTLRPSLHRSWQSYFMDRPALGGEVSSLAGFSGLSLVTIDDARALWNTPYDTIATVDLASAAKQSRFISGLILNLARTDDIAPQRSPRNGFATLNGRASFLRHGAVFADAPAPGSVILSFQGPGIYYSWVDQSGDFNLKGVATSKLTLHKVILEGYRFDERTGQTIWAVDKAKTTKDRYRVKMTKQRMETTLTMFPCTQTTIVNLLEPRTFQYMTRMQVFDARVDATPIRHWYSRIDTRSSVICSIYLQPGTRMKLALSDTLLTKKLILTHADDLHPHGNGYPIDQNPVIAPTQFLAASDMWALLTPRIENLEEKGINNQRIRDLKTLGTQALADARSYFADREYDRFFAASGNALALAGRVYDHVESIQKDVLYGVLFYIVLFAPFAFCLERLVFGFINIYKRIMGFLGILLVLITVIYNVHPAFDLAYSPIVVILAFFIIGLSGVVTWIIFNRFENEMKQLHRRGKKSNTGEISLLKAFSASFFMGVNNLRRRRVRTVLTCATLIILTFTIMSFTSVKTIRQHSRLLYNPVTPYQGLLIKQINWKSLPEQAYKIIENTMSETMVAAPRGWLETADRTRATQIPIASANRKYDASGMIGLTPRESDISGLSDMVTTGRWFTDRDRYSILIPERMAEHLNLPDPKVKTSHVTVWGISFEVIGFFPGESFDAFKDLDGESITPAIFPDEVFQQTTEAEMNALESGDEIRSFQSRYTHIPFDQTVIIPYQTLISIGGSLKSVAMKYKTPPKDNLTTFQMVDRFGLWLFSGEKNGVFLYSASDSLNYSGLPNIMIPILISMFIVLNTMIGSVQERKREIGIYTSIGMAPSHVSIIFIAEALSYAVLSVVLGYLFAQVMAKVFAATPLMAGLTVNYSSLGGVFAMAVVMLVVLLSSIYPSRVAASIAIPDVEKSWEMAPAEGNTLDVDLPFLIKAKEEASVCGFLYELFDTHRAVSHGIFSVGRLEVLQPDGTQTGSGYVLSFTAWIAPFDLGIMQEVQFGISPSPHFDDYMEIGMRIQRNSGEHNTWWRVNKRFVNLIRKQLLIWRSLDVVEKQIYETLIGTHLKKGEKTLA